MARPRVFVSSTYYDLKHVRGAIASFIESLGYDAILSEKGDIAYAWDTPLDESCYREVRNADIFVMIIGGRYGAERSGSDRTNTPEFFTRYDSITKQEYKSAVSQDLPIYILVERPVHAEYQTFLRNRTRTDITYAHVDSVNIFYLIEEIFSQFRNNPVFSFERYEEITAWLREQWSGLFRLLLERSSSQQQLASLQAQVAELAEVNRTLKRYLEEVVSSVAPETSEQLIRSESERLEEARRVEQLRANPLISNFTVGYGVPFESVRDALSSCSNVEEFVATLAGRLDPADASDLRTLVTAEPARRDFEQAKQTLLDAGSSLSSRVRTTQKTRRRT
jgi:hypothetical protein